MLGPQALNSQVVPGLARSSCSLVDADHFRRPFWGAESARNRTRHAAFRLSKLKRLFGALRGAHALHVVVCTGAVVSGRRSPRADRRRTVRRRRRSVGCRPERTGLEVRYPDLAHCRGTRCQLRRSSQYGCVSAFSRIADPRPQCRCASARRRYTAGRHGGPWSADRPRSQPSGHGFRRAGPAGWRQRVGAELAYWQEFCQRPLR
jgi:hypothetical protein